jgi:hypothetical protein
VHDGRKGRAVIIEPRNLTDLRIGDRVVLPLARRAEYQRAAELMGIALKWVENKGTDWITAERERAMAERKKWVTPIHFVCPASGGRCRTQMPRNAL